MTAQISLQSNLSSEAEPTSTIVSDIQFGGVDVVVGTEKTVGHTTVSRGKGESM